MIFIKFSIICFLLKLNDLVVASKLKKESNDVVVASKLKKGRNIRMTSSKTKNERKAFWWWYKSHHTHESCESLHPHCAQCDGQRCVYCSGSYLLIGGKCIEPVHFDDLDAGESGEIMSKVPDGYRNLNYENLYYMNPDNYIHEPRLSGYVYGVVSGKNVAYNKDGEELFIRASEGETFSVCALKLTPAWRKNLVVWIGGYKGGEYAVGKNYTLGELHTTKSIELEGYTGLSDFMICTWGGESCGEFCNVTYSSAAFAGGKGTHVVIDDIIIY